jgi:hypothetical protein
LFFSSLAFLAASLSSKIFFFYLPKLFLSSNAFALAAAFSSFTEFVVSFSDPFLL